MSARPLHYGFCPQAEDDTFYLAWAMNKPIAMSDAGSFELPASDQLTFQTVMATSLDEAITCMVEHAELEIKPDHYYYIALDMGESMIYILRVRPKVTWFTTAFNCGIYKAIPKGGRKGF